MKPKMKNKIISLTLLFALFIGAAAQAQEKSLDQMIERELGSLVTTYKTLHAAPELSHHEERTSALLAKELKALGYEVTEHFGKYKQPEWTSYGIVAVMKNGAGPVVLVRADMDALPVEETTGAAYASKVKVKNEAGQEVSVMHACGHDIHVTSLLGTAKMLKEMKDQWHGTLILIGQPAEETVHGADAMLTAGLYTQFPKPDYAIALHDSADLETGKVGYTPGFSLASSTSVDITIRGLGGHGSKPEATKDPIVIAAQVILALQTIISRENSPLDPAVVTVGAIHGGAKNNIIPDEVNLLLTIRAYKEEVRQKVIASIERITNGIAQAAGIPADRAPILNLKKEFTPATYNNPELTERLAKVFVSALGADNVVQTQPVMGAEDFGHYGLENHQIPTTIFWLGAVDPALIARSKQTGVPLPSLHSSRFAPVPDSTIRTGVKAMTSAVLDLMKK